MPALSASATEALWGTAFGVAYRILGNGADAEDMAQDAMTRLMAAAAGPRNAEAYVATIAARLSLNHLRNNRTRQKRLSGEDLPVPLAMEPNAASDARLDLPYGMTVLTMALPPLARAVFILRNGFDLTFDEIAQQLDRTSASCRQAHGRAVRVLASADRSQPKAGENELGLMRRLVALISDGDVAGLTHLLAADIVLHSDGGGRAPDLGRPIDGRERIAQFLAASPRLVGADAETRVINTVQGPLIVIEIDGSAVTAVLADYRGDRISKIYAISDPNKLSAMARRPRRDDYALDIAIPVAMRDGSLRA